jgi:hypothetical protein
MQHAPSSVSYAAPLWLSVRHPDVRDLAFAIASPPLLLGWPPDIQPTADIEWPDAAFWQQQFDHYLPRLRQLDQHPTALVQHLSALKTQRLGVRFEALLSFWLQDRDYHPFELLGQNVQQRAGTRTTGELDFVLRNHVTGALEHWEVALKFYLGEGDYSPQQWLGMNRRDTLGRKLNHFASQQFLAQSFQAEPITVRRAILKGRLFWPSGQPDPLHVMGSWLNPHHLKGQWSGPIPQDNGHDLAGTWRRASRAEWITPRDALPPPTPLFWGDGLYFYTSIHGEVWVQHVCRLRNPKPPFRPF